MRLTCPNCGAQYEVDDNVIPEGGRDVQCSNCGHTWFQRAAGAVEAEAEGSAEAPAEAAFEEPAAHQPEAEEPHETAEQHAEEPEPEVAAEAAPQPEPDVEEPEAAEPEPHEERESAHEAEEPAAHEEHEAHEETVPRRGLDEGVASILREEAARETAERRGEGAGLETQPDLGLPETPPEDDASVQQRMARLRGMDDDHGATTAAIVTGHRRDLLPDIEELNSTLTATTDEEAAEVAADVTERRRGGFRRGFVVAVLLFALLTLAYIYAPAIVRALPASEGFMTAYVDWVNTLRNSVDQMMQTAVEKLTALLSQMGADGAA